MKDEKKSRSKTFCCTGLCFFLAVVFLTGTLHGAGGLFNHDGDDNRLFSQGYLSGVEMSNQAQSEAKPRVSQGKFVFEVLAGMVGNLAGGYTAGVIGYELGKEDGSGWFDGFGEAIVGYFAGSTFGSALGVYLIGNSKNAKGSFGSALLGSLLGEALAVGVSLVAQDGDAALVSFIVLPPICSALMFNSSLKYKSPPVSYALLNFNRGECNIGIPYVQVQPLPAPGKNIKPTVKFNVNLLSIVF
jgi:hypothetical protein